MKAISKKQIEKPNLKITLNYTKAIHRKEYKACQHETPTYRVRFLSPYATIPPQHARYLLTYSNAKHRICPFSHPSPIKQENPLAPSPTYHPFLQARQAQRSLPDSESTQRRLRQSSARTQAQECSPVQPKRPPFRTLCNVRDRHLCITRGAVTSQYIARRKETCQGFPRWFQGQSDESSSIQVRRCGKWAVIMPHALALALSF